MIYPDWKIRLAHKCIKEKTTSTHKDVRNLLSVLQGTCPDKTISENVLEAHHIYKGNDFTKEVLEGCILAFDYSVEDAAIVTGIPNHIVEVYEYFFFDPHAFRYRLHKHDYVRNYDNDNVPDAKLYKQWALSVGMKFFHWHLRTDRNPLIPKEVLVDLVGDTFFRAKEHLNQPITSSVTRESLKWMKQAADSIIALQKMDGDQRDGLADQFRIKLICNNDDIAGKDEISDAEIVS